MGSVLGLAVFGTVLTHTLTDELSKRVPDLSAVTTRMDLSQVQSQALDPYRMRRELAARADSQYQQIDRAYADDPNARQDVLADASICHQGIGAPRYRGRTNPHHEFSPR